MIDRRTFLAAAFARQLPDRRGEPRAGRLPIIQLCVAIVERSDNSAAEPPVRFAAHAAVGLLVAKTFA